MKRKRKGRAHKQRTYVVPYARVEEDKKINEKDDYR